MLNIILIAAFLAVAALTVAAFIKGKSRPAPPVVYQPPSAPYEAGPEVKWPDDQPPPGPFSN